MWAVDDSHELGWPPIPSGQSSFLLVPAQGDAVPVSCACGSVTGERKPFVEFNAEAEPVVEASTRSPIRGVFVASAMTFGLVIDREHETTLARVDILPIANTTVEFRTHDAGQWVTATCMTLTCPFARSR
ncbi:hypothetical protein [Saccharopolyspora endophytica]|uniref:Uncharacterized protein n=1 Tax=Saccharopolyspora endophytica TaxID=543886 RepID=A0ABS5DKC4_9PSEU|nr:hypothetical protein [Saccharopolyspora endophytica]MBQ0926741.1 hypothetical protein [Saccharopolyspora endophytica]